MEDRQWPKKVESQTASSVKAFTATSVKRFIRVNARDVWGSPKRNVVV